MGALLVDPIKAQTLAAYRALDRAAERIGLNNYRSGIARHVKAGRSARTYRPSVSEAHRRVLEAMPALLAGEITREQAMALLHEYDIERQRIEVSS